MEINEEGQANFLEKDTYFVWLMNHAAGCGCRERADFAFPMLLMCVLYQELRCVHLRERAPMPWSVFFCPTELVWNCTPCRTFHSCKPSLPFRTVFFCCIHCGNGMCFHDRNCWAASEDVSGRHWRYPRCTRGGVGQGTDKVHCHSTRTSKPLSLSGEHFSYRLHKWIWLNHRASWCSMTL